VLGAVCQGDVEFIRLSWSSVKLARRQEALLMMIHEQMLSPFLDLLELAVAAKRV